MPHPLLRFVGIVGGAYFGALPSVANRMALVGLWGFLRLRREISTSISILIY